MKDLTEKKIGILFKLPTISTILILLALGVSANIMNTRIPLPAIILIGIIVYFLLATTTHNYVRKNLLTEKIEVKEVEILDKLETKNEHNRRKYYFVVNIGKERKLKTRPETWKKYRAGQMIEVIISTYSYRNKVYDESIQISDDQNPEYVKHMKRG